MAELIPADGPFDVDAPLASLLSHEIPGLSETDLARRTHRRILELPDGPVSVEVRLASEGIELTADTATDLEQVVRNWFDLDADLATIDAHLGADPLFAEQVRHRPGLRMTRYPDLFEAAVLIVLGQQVSLSAGRVFGGRLITEYGTDHEGLRRFPAAERIAAEPVDRLRERLRVTGARARTVRALGELFAAGGPDREDPEKTEAELLAVPGIGPWTVACFAIRALDRPDILPSSDAVVRREMGGLDPTSTEARAEPWSPYRTYATARLWARAHDQSKS